MGQALLAKQLGESGVFGIEVRSAGLDALAGQPAEDEAKRLMRRQGFDLSDHRAQQLTRKLVRWAELVLVMDTAQKAFVETWEPSARGKVYRLGEWGDFDVSDPYRQPMAVFETALGQITKGVSDWVEKLKDGAG